MLFKKIEKYNLFNKAENSDSFCKTIQLFVVIMSGITVI